MEKPAEGGRVEAPAKRPRFDALTSLRFVAAAMIMLHHLKGNMGVPLSLPFPFGHGMGFGVSFFFCCRASCSPTTIPRFPRLMRGGGFWSRFARLWPAHEWQGAATLWRKRTQLLAFRPTPFAGKPFSCSGQAPNDSSD